MLLPIFCQFRPHFKKIPEKDLKIYQIHFNKRVLTLLQPLFSTPVPVTHVHVRVMTSNTCTNRPQYGTTLRKHASHDGRSVATVPPCDVHLHTRLYLVMAHLPPMRHVLVNLLVIENVRYRLVCERNVGLWENCKLCLDVYIDSE